MPETSIVIRTFNEEQHLPGLLEAIQRLWPVGFLRVADRGVREGLLMGMMHPCIPAMVGFAANRGRELADALAHEDERIPPFAS